MNIKKSEQLANNIRKHAVTMTSLGGSSHIGSVLSIADILAVLYGSTLKYNSNDPKWVDRDRFILSKGHAGAGVYAVLAESGFMSLDKLNSHCQDGSDLSGHVSHKRIPGVEFSTGSLGHGLPVASGMTLAAKINNKKHRVFALLSDGECDEGSNWEAAMIASKHSLKNLFLIIDYNKIQSDNNTKLISKFNSELNSLVKLNDAPLIYEKLGSRFSNFFIDEFQDTSELQWENLIPLISNSIQSESHDGSKGSLLIVGDPKQSIYRWRGSKINQFVNLILGDTNPFYINPEIEKIVSDIVMQDFPY